MTDPIADMLTRIRNAQSVKKASVEVPFSKIRFEIGRILERTGFVGTVELKTKRIRRPIELQLLYKKGASAISGAKRISKPGQRIYASAFEMGKLARRRGIAIVSTPKGLLTAGEAKQQGVGGEVLCEVW